MTPVWATLMVALHLRFRLSYRRIRELLHDWLGIRLSVGTIKASPWVRLGFSPASKAARSMTTEG